MTETDKLITRRDELQSERTRATAALDESRAAKLRGTPNATRELAEAIATAAALDAALESIDDLIQDLDALRQTESLAAKHDAEVAQIASIATRRAQALDEYMQARLAGDDALRIAALKMLDAHHRWYTLGREAAQAMQASGIEARELSETGVDVAVLTASHYRTEILDFGIEVDGAKDRAAARIDRIRRTESRKAEATR
jgi:hypothetical protein